MHCPTCETPMQRTPCGVRYCPNPDCDAQKGAHDWEVVPIILHMAATKRLWQAIGLERRPPAPPVQPRPTHCWKCQSALVGHDSSFGPYCAADGCDVLDGVGLTPEEFKQRRAPQAAKVLARALRRNRY